MTAVDLRSRFEELAELVERFGMENAENGDALSRAYVECQSYLPIITSEVDGLHAKVIAL